MTKLDRRMLEYGRAREWRQLNRIHKSESQLISAIQGTILDTITECEKEANLWLMTYAKTDGVSLAEAKKAVRLKDIRALEAKAKEYVKRRQDLGFAFSEEAMKEMRRYNFGMKMNRLELLQHNLALALGMGTVDVEEIIGKHLTYATEEELRRQAGLLGLNIPDPNIMRINAEAIVNASFHEENFSQRIWKNKQELAETLDKGIKKSVMMGHNPVTWAKSLKELLRDTENDAMYKMKRIAITESGRVQIAAQRISYETAGFSQYMVICEPTACPHCMEFDGEVFSIADLVQGENAPMFHPFCRCSTTPYMSRKEVEEGFRELEEAGKLETNAVSPLQKLKSKKAVNEFFKKELGFATVDSKEISLDVLKEVAETISDFYSEYPQLKGFVKQFRVKKNLDSVAEAGMEWKPGKGTKTSITLNADDMVDTAAIKEMIEFNVGQGFWSPKAGASDIINHELAHLLEYQQAFKRAEVDPFSINANDVFAQRDAITSIRSGVFSLDVTKTAFGNLGLPYLADTISKEVSGYAAVSSRELLAEAVGCSDRNQTMIEIVKVMKEKLQ